MDSISSLAQETYVMHDGDSIRHGAKLLAESLPSAVMAIIDLATTSDSDRIRLSAAQFIVDRMLPKADGRSSDGSSPYEKLLGTVVKDLDDAAEGLRVAAAQPPQDAEDGAEGEADEEDAVGVGVDDPLDDE